MRSVAGDANEIGYKTLTKKIEENVFGTWTIRRDGCNRKEEERKKTLGREGTWEKLSGVFASEKERIHPCFGRIIVSSSSKAVCSS